MIQDARDKFAHGIPSNATDDSASLPALNIDQPIKTGRAWKSKRRMALLLIGVGAVAVIGVTLIAVANRQAVVNQAQVTIPASPSVATQQFRLPTSKAASGTEALLTGKLVRHGNCLLVSDTLVVWPRGTIGRLRDGEQVEVMSSDGKVLARTGQRLELTGGSITGRTVNVAECSHFTDTFDAWIITVVH